MTHSTRSIHAYVRKIKRKTIRNFLFIENNNGIEKARVERAYLFNLFSVTIVNVPGIFSLFDRYQFIKRIRH